jgi:hypothetical protein
MQPVVKQKKHKKNRKGSSIHQSTFLAPPSLVHNGFVTPVNSSNFQVSGSHSFVSRRSSESLVSGSWPPSSSSGSFMPSSTIPGSVQPPSFQQSLMHQSQSAASLGRASLELAPQLPGYQAPSLPPPASHLAFDREVNGIEAIATDASGNQASANVAHGSQENSSSEGETTSSSDESERPIVAVGPNNGIQPITPVEWDGAFPDAVLSRLKALKEEALSQYGLKPFYKSYNNWSKLKPDQQDKALAWFCKLPSHIQCQCF